jgi:hypothetical protein
MFRNFLLLVSLSGRLVHNYETATFHYLQKNDWPLLMILLISRPEEHFKSSLLQMTSRYFLAGVARFFLVQNTKIGEIIPNDHNVYLYLYAYKIYHMALKCSNWP